MMLEGMPAFRYKYNPKLRLYKKTPLPLNYKTNFTYEDMAKNLYTLSNIVKEANFEAAGKGFSVFYGKKSYSSDIKIVEEPPST